MIRKSDIGIGRGQQDMFLSINVFTKTYAKTGNGVRHGRYVIISPNSNRQLVIILHNK